MRVFVVRAVWSAGARANVDRSKNADQRPVRPGADEVRTSVGHVGLPGCALL